MKKFFYIFFIIFFFINNAYTKENTMIIEIKYGKIEIELYEKLAPGHVERFKALVEEGKYNGVVFHRVINGFMAQTGDVQFGNSKSPDFDLAKAGTGGSDLPNLKSEFSDTAHVRGTLSMARSSDPNSANSQLCICIDAAPHLNRQYSVFGKVTSGMNFVDMIKKGDSQSGAVQQPDMIININPKK